MSHGATSIKAITYNTTNNKLRAEQENRSYVYSNLCGKFWLNLAVVMAAMQSLPMKYCPKDVLYLFDSPEKTLADAVRLFMELGCVEKRGDYAITASFAHPDGQWVRIHIQLCYVPERGCIVVIVQRHAGDALLAALIMSYLRKCFQGETNDLKFRRGQIVPLLDRFGPNANPEIPPSMSLEDGEGSHAQAAFPNAYYGKEEPCHKRIRLC